ncbi:hypothetical protein D3C75_848410 [compost metagenome]
MLLTRHVQAVPVEHVESCPRDQAFDLVTRLRSALIEINPGFALPILRRYSGGHAIVEIATVAIHLPNRRVEIE